MTASGSSGGGVLEGEKPPLIAPGEYELKYLTYETCSYFGGKSPKVAIHFEVVTPGDAFGARLRRYYNVSSLRGKPRKKGGFNASWRADLIVEYVQIIGAVPGRKDRITFDRFRGMVIRGRVETVKKRFDQSELPKPLHYSVIKKLLRAEVGFPDL